MPSLLAATMIGERQTNNKIKLKKELNEEYNKHLGKQRITNPSSSSSSSSSPPNSPHNIIEGKLNNKYNHLNKDLLLLTKYPNTMKTLQNKHLNGSFFTLPFYLSFNLSWFVFVRF